jgi:GTP-binding protein
MTKIHFRTAKFYTTVNDLKSLPPESVQEVAIVGRSNAGKSSLLNTLTDQNKLAFTSKTPGRTQHINYFNVGANGLFLVDLPGYGYAKVPEKIRLHWVQLLGDYLQTRQQLCGLVLIMDARHPLRELDYQMLQFFKTTGKTVHLVLSKADKLTYQEKIKTLKLVKDQLDADGYVNYTLQLFSALKKTGVDELVEVLNSWLC